MRRMWFALLWRRGNLIEMEAKLAGKKRMTALDLRAVCTELQTLFSGVCRLVNVYTVSNESNLSVAGGIQTLIWKFYLSSDNKKHWLLTEPGWRAHITTYDYPTRETPSQFVARLRKLVKDRRLVLIRQVGRDRVLQMIFHSKDKGFISVVVEFFSKGNVVVCDSHGRILFFLRNDEKVPYEKGDVYQVGHPVPYDNSSLWDFTDEDGAEKSLFDWLDSKLIMYGSDVLRHCLAASGITIEEAETVKLDSLTEEQKLGLLNSLEKIENLNLESEAWNPCMKESVYYAPIALRTGRSDDTSDKDDVSPLPSFNATVDEYYRPENISHHNDNDDSTQGKGKKSGSANTAAKDTTKKSKKVRQLEAKLNRMDSDQSRRIEEAEKKIMESEAHANLIHLNAELVDLAIKSLNFWISKQMQWTEIEHALAEAKSQGVDAARRITKVDLEHNRMYMRLDDPYDEGVSGTVPIDLSKNAYQNAESLFGNRRQATTKKKATVSALEKNKSEMQKDIAKEVARAEHSTVQRSATDVKKRRKRFWFERYHWFISSDGYLVIAGKDRQQNEQVVRKYLGRYDLYVHADIHGASSVVVKNHKPGEEVPTTTLQEAEMFCVAHSSAWDNKMVTSGWWVQSDQVSKTAPAGMYVSTGAFMIYGKKNLMSRPHQLQMALSAVYVRSEEAMRYIAGSEESWQGLVEDVDRRYQDNENVDDGGEDDDEEGEEDEDVSSDENDEESVGMPPVSETDDTADSDDRSAPEEPAKRTTDTANVSRTKGKKPAGAPEKPKATNVPRGQRGKQKKRKQKYAEQDEEDRQRAMAILGHKDEDADDTEELDDTDEVVLDAEGNPSVLCEGLEQYLVPTGPRKGGAGSKNALQMTDDDTDAKAEQRIAYMLDRQLARKYEPRPDDFGGDEWISFAIPMVCPWITVQRKGEKEQRITNAVQLVPGKDKKGALCKQASYVWLGRKDMVDQEERALLQGIDQNDMIQALDRMDVKMSNAAGKGDGNSRGGKAGGGKKQNQGKGKKKK